MTMLRLTGEVSLREVAEVKEVVYLSSYPVSIVTTEHEVWMVETAALRRNSSEILTWLCHPAYAAHCPADVPVRLALLPLQTRHTRKG